MPGPPPVTVSLRDTGRPRDADGLPGEAYVVQDHIVRAAAKISAHQSTKLKNDGKPEGGRKHESRGGLNEIPTFVIKSRASAETFDGIRRSTFAIRLYVAEAPRQH